MRDEETDIEIGPGGWVLVAVAGAVTFGVLTFYLAYDLIPAVFFALALSLVVLLLLYRLAAAISRYENEDEATSRVRRIVPASVEADGAARVAGVEGASATAIVAKRVVNETSGAAPRPSNVVRPLSEIDPAPLLAPRIVPEPQAEAAPEPEAAPVELPPLAELPASEAERPAVAAKPEASPKATWQTKPGTAAKPAPEPEANPAPDAAPEPKPKAEAKPQREPKAKAEARPKAPAKVPAKAKAAAPKAQPKAEKPAARPKAKAPAGLQRLTAPRDGKADNLKEIEGIGPALEKQINALGFYHFDQLAAWTEADIALVDAEMKSFKGRITRDRWVAQARIIVTEGLEAFRERARTNNY